MIAKLVSLRGSSVVIPCEDPDSKPVADIMIMIAAFIPFATRVLVDHEHSKSSVSFLLGFYLGLQTIIASVIAFCALYYTSYDIDRLSKRVALETIPNDLSRIERLMYLNCNLWFGVKAGGSVGHIAGVVNAFLKKGIEVSFYTCTRNTSVAAKADTKLLVPQRYFGVPWDNNYYRFNHIIRDQLAKDTSHYDCIYQRLSVGNYNGVREALDRGIPLIIEYNGSEVWIAKNWGRKLRNSDLALKAEILCLQAASKIICISQPLKDELVERGFPPQKIVVYPNCIDAEKFDPDRYSEQQRLDLREKHSIADNAFVFGFIGTFGAWHGAEVLAEAFAKLVTEDIERATDLNYHMLLIGDGSLRSLVEEKLEDVPDTFYTLAGLVQQESAPLYLSICDAFCSPHVNNQDGTKFFGSPTKLYEYMAMRKPIIASDLDQIGEVLRDGSCNEKQLNAILVPPGNVDELAVAMKELYLRKDKTSLAQNAYDLAMGKYTWSNHVDAILES
ncbi:MAG: hypothetical protein NPIRA05_00080 [Nitrospirales bacterium]|nr:MAG: hypothetical protein NPIRA05_00080 [Nitrospirales bacterium]